MTLFGNSNNYFATHSALMTRDHMEVQLFSCSHFNRCPLAFKDIFDVKYCEIIYPNYRLAINVYVFDIISCGASKPNSLPYHVKLSSKK